MENQEPTNDSKETTTVYTGWQINEAEERRKKEAREACLAKGDEQARWDEAPGWRWVRNFWRNNVAKPVGAFFDGSTAHQHNTKSDTIVAETLMNGQQLPAYAGVTGAAISFVSEDNSISNSRKNAAGMGVIGVNKLSAESEYLLYYNQEESLGRKAMSFDEWDKEKGEEYRQSLSAFRNKFEIKRKNKMIAFLLYGVKIL